MSAADFWRLCGIIARRRWVVLTSVVVAMSLVGVGVLLLPRYYQATAMVMPSDEALKKPVITGAAVQDGGRQPEVGLEGRAQQLQNLLFLAESQAVLEAVNRELELGMTAAELQSHLTVEPLPNTSLLNITAMMKDGEDAKKVANAVARQFVDFYRDLSHREAIKNRRFLESELRKAETDLGTAEKALADFKRQSDAEPLAVTELASDPIELERDSTEAELREVTAKAAAVRRQVKEAPPTVVTETGSSDNPVVADLQKQLVTLESELASARAIKTDKHPEVIALQARVADLRGRLQREMGQVVKHTTVALNPLHARLLDDLAQYEAQRAALGAKARALRSVTGRRSAEKRVKSAQGVRLAALTRDYRVAEETYTRLKASLEQAAIDENIANNTDEIRIVDMATTAKGPVTKGPTPTQLLLFGFFASLALGLGIALAMDLLDNRVQTSADAERLLELPVTGVIPEIAGYSPLQLPTVSRLAPISSYAEAYRFLRTDLLFDSDGKHVQTVMVATARPGQGGTTTICNLAISLAEAGKRVVLVDADLRRPSLHHIFAVDNSIGLTNVLIKQVELEAALRPTGTENLLVLPAGQAAANPSVLINSVQMKELVNRLRQECDFVLFDTPSAVAFSDAAVLSSMLDGVLLVVRAQQSPRASEQEVRKLLDKAGATILGVVLNDVPQRNVDSFHYHEEYYQPRRALEAAAAQAALPAGQAAEPAAQAAVEQPVFGQPAAPYALEAPVTAPPRAGRWRLWAQAGAIVAALAVLGVGGYLLTGAGRHPAAAKPAAAAKAPGVVVVGQVKEQAWVRVTIDGKLSYEGPLLPGRNEWQGQREVTVRVAQPQNVEFTVNGKKVGVLESVGNEPAVRTFTR